LVALRQLLPLGLEHGVEFPALLRERLLEALDLRRRVLRRQTDVEPVVALDRLQVLLGDLGALREALGTAVGGLAVQQALQALEGIALDDAHLVGEVGLVALELVLDDALASLVALDALAGEDLDIDDRAADSRGNPQARVLNVRSLFTEDRAEELLFRR